MARYLVPLIPGMYGSRSEYLLYTCVLKIKLFYQWHMPDFENPERGLFWSASKKYLKKCWPRCYMYAWKHLGIPDVFLVRMNMWLWLINSIAYDGLSGIHYHDDVIKWKRFPRCLTFVWGIHRSPKNSPHKGQWRGALMFSFICAWINGWVNNRKAGDFRRHRGHYDVTVIPHSASGYGMSITISAHNQQQAYQYHPVYSQSNWYRLMILDIR